MSPNAKPPPLDPMPSTLTISDYAAALAVARSAGIKNLADLHAFAFVCDHGEPTAGEIAQRLRISAPLATLIIDRLESLSLVRREPSRRFGADHRVVRIHPTFQGRELIRLILA